MMKLFKRSVTLPPATVTTVARRIVDRFKPRAQRSRDDTLCLAHSSLPQPACWCAENQLENRLSLAPHRPTPRFYLYYVCEMHAAGGAGCPVLACLCFRISKLFTVLAQCLTPARDVFSRRDHVSAAAGCSFVRLVSSRVHHGRTPRRVPMQRLMPSHLSPAKSPLTRSPWLPPGSTSVLALGPPHEWPIEWPEVADGCRRLRSRCQSSSSAASGRAAAPHHSNPRSRHRWHT